MSYRGGGGGGFGGRRGFGGGGGGRGGGFGGGGGRGGGFGGGGGRGGGFGGGGGRGGGFGGGRGRGGGFGGNRFDRRDQAPGELVEVGIFTHTAQEDLIVEVTHTDVPYFNAPIFLPNNEQIGKVDEVFGSPTQKYVSVKLGEGMKASSLTAKSKLCIDSTKLLPLRMFLPGNEKRGGGRGRGGRGGGRGRGGGGRGRGGFGGGRGGGFGRGGGRGGGFGRGGGRGGGFRR